MKKNQKVLIIGAVILLAILAMALKPSGTPPATGAVFSAATNSPSPAANSAAAVTPAAKAVPRLVDLGADKCIPCKMMAPILEELRQEYAGRMEVVFIDVWKDPYAGRKYGIEVIPTQIFYDAQGKELGRHVGFISKEDILRAWKELGVDFARSGPAQP